MDDLDDPFGNPFGEPNAPVSPSSRSTANETSAETMQTSQGYSGYYQTQQQQPEYENHHVATEAMTTTDSGAAFITADDEAQHQQQEQQSQPQQTPPPPPVLQVQHYNRVDSNPYKSVTVPEQEKRTDSTGSYVSYKVVVILAGSERAIVFHRRFRDFYWLMTTLMDKFPGVIVPPTPEKKEIGKFNPDFVERRRMGLESMMQRLIQHPILVGSAEVRMFLETENLDSIVDYNTRSLAGRKSFLSFLGSAISSPYTKIILPDEDPWFDARKKQIEQLAHHMHQIQTSIEAIAKHRKEMGTSVSDFWDSITTLSSSADSNSVFSTIAHLGGIQQKVEDVHHQLSGQYMIQFGFIVEEYIRILESVRIVLAVRDRYVNVLKGARSSLQKKQGRLDALVSQNKGDAVNEISREVTELQRHVKSCQDNVDQVSALVREEFARFDSTLAQDFEQSTAQFATFMITGEKEILGWWEQYKPEYKHAPSPSH